MRSVWGYGYIRCEHCKRRLKIRLGQRSRLCPYCGKRTKVVGFKIEKKVG